MKVTGFVDLQVNGFRGVNFSGSDLTDSSFRETCQNLLQHGTAAFLPTIVTSPEEIYRHNLPLMAKVLEEPEFQGRLLGFHVEGPFISPKPGAVGAHNPDWVRAPDPAFLDQLIELSRGNIRLLTVAADVKGAPELVAHAADRGITVSLGHQLANAEDLERALKAGATALTHLGNGITNMLPRHPNTIWEGLAEDRLMMMVITDGSHLAAPVLKAMLRAKGIDKSVVVSDAAHLAGMPPGHYQTNGHEVILEPNGKLHDPKRECLVGSSFTMLECMNFLATQGWYDLDTLLMLSVHNPLKLIGLNPKSVKLEETLTFDKKKGFITHSG